MYFWIYGRRNTSLNKGLKSSFSEDPSTRNIVNGLKHSSNLDDSTFAKFIGTCEGNSGLKSLSELNAKS